MSIYGADVYCATCGDDTLSCKGKHAPKWTVPPRALEQQKPKKLRICEICGRADFKSFNGYMLHLKSCKKADRDFVKAFTPNKYGEYA